MINFEDFKKVEMAVGKILSAEKAPETDKLVKLLVDFGEEKPRQIISGIAEYFPDLAKLVGNNFLFVVNLEPRTIKGFESDGMILAVKDGKNFSLFKTPKKIKPGARAN